jgi:hypothetical protein
MSSQQARIERIREQMAELGPVLPGGISKHWNVCGKPGCRCKHPSRPKKHGPYYQLSFTLGGKSSSMFLRADEVGEARRWVRRYARLKELTQQLLRAHVAWARQGGLSSEGRRGRK